MRRIARAAAIGGLAAAAWLVPFAAPAEAGEARAAAECWINPGRGVSCVSPGHPSHSMCNETRRLYDRYGNNVSPDCYRAYNRWGPWYFIYS